MIKRKLYKKELMIKTSIALSISSLTIFAKTWVPLMPVWPNNFETYSMLIPFRSARAEKV